MTALQDQIATALRDYITDGVPASGAYTPLISDLRTILDGMAVGSQWITEIGNVSTGFLNAATPAAALDAIGIGSDDSVQFGDITVVRGVVIDTNTLVVNSTTNRVGIGTNSPTTGLDVVVAANFGSDMVVAGAATFQGPVTFDGGTLYVDNSNNRVGVGTLTPSVGFHVAQGGALVESNQSTSAFKVTQTGTGAVALFEDAASDGSPFTILTDGAIVQGFTAPIVALSGLTPIFQIHGTTVAASFAAMRWSTDSGGAGLVLNKSRGSSVNSRGGVSINDGIGSVLFSADDGTNFITAAQINAYVDGTPSANDMPGRLVFSTTPDGSATPAERMRIDSTGFVSFGGDTDTGIVYPGANELAFWSGGAEAFRIEENGRLIIGHTDSIATNKGGTSTSYDVQVHGATAATAGIAITNWGAVSGTDPSLVFGKSMSGAIGSRAAVGSGDNLGAIGFSGDDGTNFATASYILSECDGTVSAGVVPGRLLLYTANPSGVLTEQMRIDSAGGINFYNLASAAAGTAVSMTGTAFHTNTSSIRYKSDVKDLTASDIDEVLKMRPVSYHSRSKIDNPNDEFIGFIAEEMVEVDHRLVEYKDGIPESVRYDRVTVLLAGAVKTLSDRLNALEAR
jgi:hypothetical protein